MTQKPLLMGVLNRTPDSFFDKGAYFALEDSVQRALAMVAEGADLIDIGGVSSRAGAEEVEEPEEYARVIPLLEALEGTLPIPLSIDSSRPKIVKKALSLGVKLINDIRGFQDPKMRELAASSQADLCVMHMRGSPQTMHLHRCYPEGVVEHVRHFFENQIELLIKQGVNPNRIILDPGIGFSKTPEDNLALFKAIPQFKRFGLRILIGASRKGFMTKLLGKPTHQLLAPTLAMHTLSLLSGADIIRAHDISEHRDTIDILFDFISNSM